MRDRQPGELTTDVTCANQSNGFHIDAACWGDATRYGFDEASDQGFSLSKLF
jgi:hypothetical protein